MLQRVYTRVSKSASRYSDRGSAAEHCSACRFFMSGGDCARVLGRVLPQGWCKYFSQETVQRWNPLWQMAGIPAPPGATLDLSFLNPGTLDPRITFTRASTATYTNYAGVMQTAAANTPRWDYNPATLALNGLLIEEARVNLALQSGNLANAAWSLAQVGTPAVPTVTANQTTAPDGTLTAASIVYPAVSGAGNTSILYQLVGTTAAQYTWSVWLRGSVGGEQIYLGATTGGTTFYNGGRITLTTAWQRFTMVSPVLTASSWGFTLGTDLRDGGQAATSAQTIYAWGAQVEQGAFPTSYIPTAGATVTRSADLCIIPPANMGWFVAPGGTWMAEYFAFGAGSRIIGYTTTGQLTPLYLTNLGQVAQYDGGGAANTINGSPFNQIDKGATNYAPGTGKACLNGGAIGSAALTTGYGLLNTGGLGFLTAAGAGSADNTSGYIRRVRYWPRVLSDAEMQAVTT